MTDRKVENTGCLSIFLPFLNLLSSSPIKALPYRLRDDFLSKAECSFYKVLRTLVRNRLEIHTKVRLADIFYVARPNENRAYINKIDRKHVDFLVCDAVTLKPVLGIELDDSSHARGKRAERDRFVNEVFESAGLPLLRVPARNAYDTGELSRLLAPYLRNQGTESSPFPTAQPPLTGDAGPPMCPKCGIPLVVRSISQGPNKGKHFYGCRNYPRCREMQIMSFQKTE